VIIFFVFNFSARGSIADAIRYFCLNSIAAGALLVSLGLGTHVTGTANYYEFGNFFMLNPNIAYISENFNVAVILFLVGSLFKLGIFPFNVYEVDTYKNSSYVVIFFAAIVSKVPFFFV
jgi:NADH:ubiquinone oxidoreductase subunit 2 (subunit N)